jgi:hypothetical protein
MKIRIGKVRGGQRFRKQYWSVIVPDCWFSERDSKWVPTEQVDWSLSHSTWDDTVIRPNCKRKRGIGSIKAFKRYIHKHSKYLPKGTTFILSGKYVNQAAYYTTK